MQATEHVLRAFQRAEVGQGSLAPVFVQQFARVAQLLEGDPDAVQMLGRVQRAGGIDHRSKAFGTLGDPRLQGPLPYSLRAVHAWPTRLRVD